MGGVLPCGGKRSLFIFAFAFAVRLFFSFSARGAVADSKLRPRMSRAAALHGSPLAARSAKLKRCPLVCRQLLFCGSQSRRPLRYFLTTFPFSFSCLFVTSCDRLFPRGCVLFVSLPHPRCPHPAFENPSAHCTTRETPR